jgi:hypothetical protein
VVEVEVPQCLIQFCLELVAQVVAVLGAVRAETRLLVETQEQ